MSDCSRVFPGVPGTGGTQCSRVPAPYRGNRERVQGSELGECSRERGTSAGPAARNLCVAEEAPDGAASAPHVRRPLASKPEHVHPADFAGGVQHKAQQNHGGSLGDWAEHAQFAFPCAQNHRVFLSAAAQCEAA